MVKVYTCKSCGRRSTDLWRSADACSGCGGQLEVEVVDLGKKQWAPRILKYAGIVMLVLFFIMIIWGVADPPVSRTHLSISLYILILAVALFALSLLFSNMLSRDAKRMADEGATDKRTRRVRGKGGGTAERVVSGSMRRPKATKIPLDRKR